MNLSENSIPTLLLALIHYLNHTEQVGNDETSNVKILEDLTTVCLF